MSDETTKILVVIDTEDGEIIGVIKVTPTVAKDILVKYLEEKFNMEGK